MPGTRNSGRKKKPTAELAALGSWRAKVRDGIEPTRIDAEVECPEWLDDTARQYWQWHYPMLQANGTMSAPDAAAFAMLCQRWSDWREAKRMCDTRGRDMPVKDADGRTIGAKRAPWDMRERDLFNQYVQLCREFGLTPSSRSNVTAINMEPKELEDCIT